VVDVFFVHYVAAHAADRLEDVNRGEMRFIRQRPA